MVDKYNYFYTKIQEISRVPIRKLNNENVSMVNSVIISWVYLAKSRAADDI